MVAEERTPMFSAIPEDWYFQCSHDSAYCWTNVKDCSARAMTNSFGFQQNADGN